MISIRTTISTMVGLAMLPISCAQAQDASQSLTLYGGPATRRYVSDIFLHGNFDLDGVLLGVAYDRRLAALGGGFTFEGELQVNHLFMDHSYSSISGGAGLRYDTTRWIGRPSSFAVYTGPSYADDGAQSTGKRNHFLEYVSLEFAVSSINKSNWDGVIRMYHRSGAFGVYGKNTDTGSTFGIGIRRRF